MGRYKIKEMRFFLQLHPEDNVVVVIRDVKKGDSFMVNGKKIVIKTDLESCHKIAIKDIKTGEKIIKCGTSIGSATSVIAPGEHVHVHNMRSDYIPTYTLKDEFNG